MNKQLLLPGICALFLAACNSPVRPQVEPTAILTRLSPTSPPVRTPFPSPTVQPTISSDAFAFEQNRRLGRGVNLGNALEAPAEGEWGVTLEEEYFDLIKEAGFTMVRVPIRWSAHAGTGSPFTIDPAFFQRVDWVIEQATRRGLAAVINVHHYEEIMESPQLHEDRFLAIWEQIANHYQGQPDSVMFEVLNEPNGALSAAAWNNFAAEAIRVIRKTHPERILIVGPGDWNTVHSLLNLQLPPQDRRIIVTIHYYLPFHFTHQGAEWVKDSESWLGTPWKGTEEDRKPIQMDFDTAAQWASQTGRPVFVGEFGAYRKADGDSRARWTAFIGRQAEEHGFSWAYWEFCSGFGVYDPSRKAWNEGILQALIPED